MIHVIFIACYKYKRILLSAKAKNELLLVWELKLYWFLSRSLKKALPEKIKHIKEVHCSQRSKRNVGEVSFSGVEFTEFICEEKQ